MAKNRNNMLGVGGQRRKVSRAGLRGGPGGGRGPANDGADAKRTLAESMRERLDAQRRTAEQETSEDDTSENNTAE
ncbi:DUF6243 family protein [Actinomadura oligospora]|uniref:DUF6243 family protein n=1 Tax=Actinomadura oligospora TaxID=111804 RepID=UPI000479F595|nr:DUF6243 family protein [Actinomadura oligospora]